MGLPKGPLKSRFNAGFLQNHAKKLPEIHVHRQVYQITLDPKLIYRAMTQLFSSNSRFHALKYVESRHHAFPLGGPYNVIWEDNADWFTD